MLKLFLCYKSICRVIWHKLIASSVLAFANFMCHYFQGCLIYCAKKDIRVQYLKILFHSLAYKYDKYFHYYHLV